MNFQKFSLQKGPHPSSVKCENKEIKNFCETFASVDWLKPCKDKVDQASADDLKKACLVDLCADFSLTSKKQIVQTYVEICRKDQNKTFLCDWETNFSGRTLSCGKNEIYAGCASECDIITCEDTENEKSNCNENAMIPSGCICKKNFFLKNGNCVQKSSCELQSWSDWSAWTECSDPCLEGSEGTKSYGFSHSPSKILSLKLIKRVLI